VIPDCAFQPGPAFGLGEILPEGAPDILGGAKVLSVNDVFGIGSMVIEAVGLPFFAEAAVFPGLLKPDKAVPKLLAMTGLPTYESNSLKSILGYPAKT
jgi:hypothetical protein